MSPLLFPLVIFISLLGAGYALPLQITVNQRQSECVFDTLKKDETISLSAIILSGSSLKATLTFDGPIAALGVDSGLELFMAAENFGGGGEGFVTISEVIDFEHLSPPPEEEEYKLDSHEEDEGLLDPNDPDIVQKRKERRERQRQKFLDAKERRERKKMLLQTKVRQDGEPATVTTKAPADGWYRMCIQATWYQIVAEFEMRKESELGGLDKNGNVISFEDRTMNEEDSELEGDTASQEGIKVEDFDKTRAQIKDLRRVLNEIQSMQQNERRRLAVHAETNQHSHSRMVLSSLFETVLFIAISGFQIYTIRKWFSGAPVLGR